MEISEVEPFLYLGSARNIMRNIKEFKNLNIDIVINCSAEITYGNTFNFTIENYPMNDDIDSAIINYVDIIADSIHNHLTNDKKIYVHGKSILSAIIIYYLMKYKKLTYNQAVSKLLSIRPNIMMNSNYVYELKLFEKLKNLQPNVLRL